MTSLASFRNCHAGATVVVCGCGASLNELEHPEQFVTIGVNDVGRKFQPDYLVVVNPRNQFKGDRFQYVENSQARHIFTQLDLGISHPGIVRFRLGQYGGTDLSDPEVLHYTRNSPYVAVGLAALMGARRIGLIGVDFADDHFFAATGRHPLAGSLEQINKEYTKLGAALNALGIEVWNLGSSSRLDAFPKASIKTFGVEERELRPPTASPLKIVSYATTPLAGVPIILARCIRAKTAHNCRCVWARNGYGNGVSFEREIQWTESPAQAVEALEEADVVVLHNGKVDPAHASLIKNKPVVTLAHNYSWNVDDTYVQKGFPGLVVGQYQATLPEFAQWTAVPNPVPFWEEAFKPQPKPGTITICYTPSGKHERYAQGDRLYWHAKGYATTMRVLDQLAARYPVQLEVIRNGQVSHAESLAMKRRSHIVIDECVTGSYHRNSLEGLATGCVVVNGVGQKPEIASVLQHCAESGEMPFERATLDNLEQVLAALLQQGSESLAARGAQNRLWLERHWNFGRHWARFWHSAIDRALNQTNMRYSSHLTETHAPFRGENQISVGAAESTATSERLITVVLPYGGHERLPQLAAILATLRQCHAVGEIIVSELGTRVAQEIAQRWNAKYFRADHAGLFEKARALDLGSAFAERDLLLWLDADLIMEDGFLARAIEEIHTRNLDVLVPYSSIAYLSQSESLEFIAGTKSQHDCHPENILTVHQVSGGAMLIRRSFLLKFGGVPHGFRGWGGEDDAWFWKASLLGRTAKTNLTNQRMYHLHHANSGGYKGGSQIRNNPHYAENVKLLNGIRAIRRPEHFLDRFPTRSLAPCPWNDAWRIRLMACKEDTEHHETANDVAQTLKQTFDCIAEVVPGLNGGKTDSSTVQLLTNTAVVLFGRGMATRFWADAELVHARPRTVIVASESERNGDWSSFSGAGGIVTRTNGTCQTFTVKDARLAHCEAKDGRSLALTIAHCLSGVLAGKKPRPTAANSTPAQVVRAKQNLPVWLYWEGECPEWIKECRRTILAHAPNARLLDPDSFDALWNEDRDIDLSSLQIAHRADFIRAFLLAHYGGLWVDSDCLVMQPLAPVLDILNQCEFVAHRERGGLFSNAFIGASHGSRIANIFYKRICETLRRKQPIGWISLGGEPLSAILESTMLPWHEIDCGLIQPICWSTPAAFFTGDSDVGHERVFSSEAICYMLSTNHVRKYANAHKGADLLKPDTFFTYLRDRSLDLKLRDSAPSNLSRKESPFCHSSFFLQSIDELAPEKVLDADGAAGFWGLLLRDWEKKMRASKPQSCRIHLEGLFEEEPPSQAFHSHFLLGSRNHNLKNLEGNWDLMILGESLEGLAPQERLRLLRKAMQISKHVFIHGTVAMRCDQQPERLSNDLGSAWNFLDLLSLDPVRYRIERRSSTSGEGAFLFSGQKSAGRQTTSPLESPFRQMIQEHRQVACESLSGPGSSLTQTTEIRRRLPLLLQHLKVSSLLDVPCGDFHWMEHVGLGIEQYIGADILPEVVAQNRTSFARDGVKFVRLDITKDALPAADLILCRDCLGHLALKDVFRALGQFQRSGSRYLLTTTFPGKRTNRDLLAGEWQPLNLEAPPFCLPHPLCVINEKCTESSGSFADKSLALWRLSDFQFGL
jgi:SAM-dependent methyltransferase